MSRIKAIRKRMDLTQAALAAGIGCSQANVGHYENKGQTVPPSVARNLIAFARTRGHVVTYEDIYGPVDHADAGSFVQCAERGVSNV